MANLILVNGMPMKTARCTGTITTRRIRMGMDTRMNMVMVTPTIIHMGTLTRTLTAIHMTILMSTITTIPMRQNTP